MVLSTVSIGQFPFPASVSFARWWTCGQEKGVMASRCIQKPPALSSLASLRHPFKYATCLAASTAAASAAPASTCRAVRHVPLARCLRQVPAATGVPRGLRVLAWSPVLALERRCCCFLPVNKEPIRRGRGPGVTPPLPSPRCPRASLASCPLQKCRETAPERRRRRAERMAADARAEQPRGSVPS
eukprot:scaffold66_cov233-Pinguiococcus_pyrenoidosus.AAC.7